MENLSQRLNFSMKWNTIEGVLYKFTLAFHQLFFFWIASKYIYGLSSTIFAITYLTVEITNLGFDRSLARFFHIYTANKKNFIHFFVPQITFQVILLAVLGLGLILGYNTLGYCFSSSFKCGFLSTSEWLLISVIILSESIRKSLKIIAQLLFLNKKSALLEICLIFLYTAIFWGNIWYFNDITINIIYMPLLIQSLVGVVVLLTIISHRPAPQFNNDSIPTITWRQILFTRISIYGYQLSELVFSGNFLITLFASIVGVVNIGPLKLANYIAVFLKTILTRTFGLSSLSVLARTKNLSQSQVALFNKSQQRLVFVLKILSSMFLVLSLATVFGSYANYYPALMFFGFALVNNFFIVYEQLFIIRNQIGLFFVLNTTTSLIFLFVAKYLNINIIALIATLIALRICTLLYAKNKIQ